MVAWLALYSRIVRTIQDNIQNKMFDWISPSKLFQLISPSKHKDIVESTVMDADESRMVTDLFVKPDGSPMAFVMSPKASRQQVGYISQFNHIYMAWLIFHSL